MDEYQKQLKQYINSHLAAGTAPDDIRTELLRAGWPADMVADAFSQVHTGKLPAPVGTAGEPAEPSHLQHQKESAHIDTGMSEQDSKQAAPATEADTNTPDKYTVSRSIIDGIKAMKNNFPAYLSATVSSMLIGGTVLVLVSVIGAMLLAHYLNPMGYTNLLAGLAITLGIVVLGGLVLQSVVYGFMSAAMSYPLISGADHKQDNVFAILLHALKRVPMLIACNIVIFLLAMGPFAILLIITMAVAFGARSLGAGSTGALFLVPLMELAATVWAIIVFFRYALTPYVLMFEEKDTLRQALKRSNFLLSKGGKWFLVKGVVGLLVIFTIFLIATGQNMNDFQQVDSLRNDIFALVLIVLINNSLVMLYRNRRAVRGNGQ